MTPEEQKAAHEAVSKYLNEKPAIKSKGGFWNKAIGFLAVAAKAYLRYEEIKAMRK